MIIYNIFYSMYLLSYTVSVVSIAQYFSFTLNTKQNKPYSVCELDLVFSLHKSLMILFEMFIGGMLCESNRREVLQQIVEAEELVEQMTKPGEDTSSQLDDGLSFQEQFQLGRKPGARGPRGNR